MYPRLLIHTKKIEENAQWVVGQARALGLTVTGINKNTCQNPDVAQALLRGGVDAIGDARIENLKKIQTLDCEKWLIRIPMPSEVENVVKYADLSVNSEVSVIQALDAAAARHKKNHQIIVMVDLGDLREGYFDIEDFCQSMETILTLTHITFMGIGVNLSCTGAIVPTVETYEKFALMQEAMKERFGVSCPITSGGASSTFYMIKDGILPQCINNLRVGELILYGTDVSNHLWYPELHHHTFILETEVIEVKDKPSVPIGKVGKDAFGNEPVFEDKGIRHRAICALGQQDTDPEGLTPLDPDIEIIAASSDHLILDITDCPRKVLPGSIIAFRCNYGAGLHANTSPYIEKIIVDGSEGL